MVRMLKPIVLAGAIVLATAPANAAFITLPFVGDIAHPDMDPFHVVSPEPAAAPAPAAPMKMKRHKMKKKMMKKTMS